MTYEWTLFACLFLALWSAVIGGVFSAFSEFIMSALLRLDASAGIGSMQQINRTVIRTQFVAGIILIAPLSIAFAIYGWTMLDGTARLMLILAPIIYVPSVFLMTIFGNVPMNNMLEKLDRDTQASEPYWRHYGRVWTRLNHFRTWGCVFTALTYLVGSVAIVSNG